MDGLERRSDELKASIEELRRHAAEHESAYASERSRLETTLAAAQDASDKLGQEHAERLDRTALRLEQIERRLDELAALIEDHRRNADTRREELRVAVVRAERQQTVELDRVNAAILALVQRLELTGARSRSDP